MKVAVPMELNQKEELFTHKDEDGTFRHFPVRIMYETAERFFGVCPSIMHAKLPLEQDMIDFFRKNHGVEQERLDRLKAPYLFRPMIGILWEDNQTMTVVDGNHRYIKLYEMGHRFGKFHVFKYPFWQQFCIPLPSNDGLLKGRSMILEHEAEKATK